MCSSDLQKVERIGDQRRQITMLKAELSGVRQIETASASVPPRAISDTVFHHDAIKGDSLAIRSVLETVRKVAVSDSSVLLRGESGTGKELLARVLHENSSRRNGPMVPVHCSSLAPTLLESELFGHAKGAFTGAYRDKIGRFELADGGTLFLDEIGDMSPAMQKKLLRVLQEGEVRPAGSDKVVTVDVRLLVARHRDLAQHVAEGSFREDLFYRIDVLSVELPSLRERVEDIPLLAEHLLARAAREAGRAAPELPHEVVTALCAHDWPGNVRELENEMRRLVVLAPERVELSSLSKAVLEGRVQAGKGASTVIVDGDLRATIAQFERSAIEDALARADGNKSQAGRDLGISRFALQRKLEKYGLDSGESSVSGEEA